MNTKEMQGLLMSMLKDKEPVLKALSDALEECQEVSRGCEKALDQWDDGHQSEHNVRQQLRAAINTNRRQSDLLQKLALVCLVYVMSSDYSAAATEALARLGLGQEALREMFKQKLEGRG